MAVGLNIEYHFLNFSGKSLGAQRGSILSVAVCTKVVATKPTKGTPLEGFVRAVPGLLKAGGIKVRGFENALIFQMVKIMLCIQGLRKN